MNQHDKKLQTTSIFTFTVKKVTTYVVPNKLDNQIS